MNLEKNLTLDSLRAFVAFARRLNFTHAAEDLELSQPSLHVKIQELTRLLGVALYTRHGRRLELTQAGRQLALFGREMADRVSELTAVFQAEQQPLVLASGQGAFRYLLGPTLQAYLQQGTLKLRVCPGEEALRAVEERTAHLAVTVVSCLPTGLASRLVREVGHQVLLPRDHPLARRRKPLALRDLQGQTLVVPPAGRPHRLALEQHLGDFQVGVEAEGWDLILQFASLGLGLAVVNDFCQAPPGLVARPLLGLPRLAYRAVYRTDFLRREARAFLDLLDQPGALRI